MRDALKGWTKVEGKNFLPTKKGPRLSQYITMKESSLSTLWENSIARVTWYILIRRANSKRSATAERANFKRSSLKSANAEHDHDKRANAKRAKPSV